MCSATSHKHLFLECLNCRKVVPHNCKDWETIAYKLLPRDAVKVTPHGGMSVDNGMKELPLQVEDNNILATITKRGFKFTKEPVYMEDVPKSFSCKYGIFSDRMVGIIMKNRQL